MMYAFFGFGVLSIIAAIILGSKIKEVKLPVHSRRLVAYFCAAAGYFVVPAFLKAKYKIPLQIDVSNIYLEILQWGVFGGMAIWLIYKLISNRNDEFKEVLKSSLRLTVIVGLLVVARFCFAAV